MACYTKSTGPAAESWTISLTWPDGRVERKGNNGVFQPGMAGDATNFRAFGEWSPEAETLLAPAAQERALWAPLGADIYQRDYRNRSFSDGTSWVRLPCGLEVQLGAEEARARVALGEVAAV